MRLVLTEDGSYTLFNELIGEHYHSTHGAVQESRHVFLQAGLIHFLEIHSRSEKISVLEVGFGTGLNFLLSAAYCLDNGIQLDYCGIEAHPLDEGLLKAPNYGDYVDPVLWEAFLRDYPAALDKPVLIQPGLNLGIVPVRVLEFTQEGLFDLLYFDAFGTSHQPEMWTDEVLKHVCRFLKPGGTFVTYAITGQLKRSLKALGFTIEKLPGAPGKREMLRAVKGYLA
ncbi:tRNA U34 5-methylaminomethyl-2-thiouridine-forming methyltransferase MnmC [bacterium A37T11]|nr:tRNA U34 5-methylaminomethyl-2-thiouridine-forming methyltransferase MnmC [bacterium A37T11]